MFEQIGAIKKITRVQTHERDTFPALRGHVEAVIPVGVLQTRDIMFTDVKKLDQMLDQNVLQNGTLVNAVVKILRTAALLRRPGPVIALAAERLGIAKITLAFNQNIRVPGLVDIK